jgi:hypothetical protein
MTSSLDCEFQAYNRLLPTIVQEHAGKYVVIKDSELKHFSDTYEDALDWAYGTFGLERFFVKKVAPDHDVAHFTRDLGPCHS